jgi:anti-sigma-K factor RskA
MDQKEYIDSGILELYASGGLSSSEAREVEAMASSHPEIAYELSKITETVTRYASGYEVNPRPALRKLIVDKVRKSSAEDEQAKMLNTPKRSASSFTYKYLLAACLASLVISTFASYFFYNRWSESEDKNLTLLNEKTTLAANHGQLKKAFDQTYRDLLIMRDMNTKMFALQSIDTAQNYMVKVYWNSRSHESYIDIITMPEPAQGMQYQLWAMVNGQPVDAGMIEMKSESGIHRMKKVFEADGWAITVEPSGGSVVPTLTSLMLRSNS